MSFLGQALLVFNSYLLGLNVYRSSTTTGSDRTKHLICIPMNLIGITASIAFLVR